MVVYGVKSVGCNLQPIAAVRRVGAVTNIVYNEGWTVEWRWVDGGERKLD